LINVTSRKKIQFSTLYEILLLLLIITGVVYRFNWRNWSQGTSLHPDEYGLTNTLTQLSIPTSVGEYFNTRISPLSPYQKYDIDGQPTIPGPDNRMRWGQWPIILYRWVGEISANTGYNEIRLTGRAVSAFADTLSLIFIFMIGKRLYGRKVGLLGAALSSLAVMQIQQSHFMTSDNIAALFSTANIYALVRIAQAKSIRRSTTPFDNDLSDASYKANVEGLLWYGLFGITFGMALASRINLLPLFGILLVATFISVADLKLKSRVDIRRIAGLSIFFIVFSVLITLITFRLTQPMSFRSGRGDTSFLTLDLNPDWLESMKVASMESKGIGGGPPSEQWAKRPAIIFPLINMVVWGMGLPLGLVSWIAFFRLGWGVLRSGENWRAHAILLFWIGGYFFFMGTRFVKSIRYFLPIYPFLALFAAYLLTNIWTKSLKTNRLKSSVLPLLAQGIVIGGTLIWATAFVRAIYVEDHTRIQASRWIYENISPGSVISNESWDESLPLPLDGHNPFGDLYQGVRMEVRWYDDEAKKEMFLENLQHADYIILPSQRAIWSASRIPLTYPMTLEYYEALFDGRLGFDLAASFSSPLKIGKLWISDVGGTWAWGKTPDLPLFNTNWLAAEEAFSVYDHPPVWIFQKRPDFDMDAARELLESIDLITVIIQSPRDADW
jgi:hypothetical protein